jgi:hypothetical protein
MNPRLKTVGLQVGRAMLVGTASGPRVWLHDIQPSQNIQAFVANVAGSVFICVFRGLQLNLGDQFHAYSSIRNSGGKLNPQPTAKAVGFFPFQ